MPCITRRRGAGGVAKLSPGIKILLLAVAFCLCGGLLVDAQPSDAADALTSQPNISGRPQEGTGDSLRANEAAKNQTIPLSPQEKAWLRDHPVIRVAQDPGWPPIEFVDEQGKPSGMAADYLKLIEQRLGIKFHLVTTPSWQEAYAKLKRWEIDMTTSVTVTPERTKFWAFTKPYMKIPIAIFAQSDVTYLANMQALSGKKVAVVAGYAVNDWIPKDFPNIRLVKVSSARDGLYLLQQGEVFAFIDNMLVVSYYLAKLKVANVKIAGETPYSNAQSMAVRKDWPILVGILQKALDSISQRERDEIYQKWLPLRYEHGFNYTLLWQALAVFFMILLGLLVWNRKLVREIKQRKAAEIALSDSEERFRQLFRIAAVPMSFVNKDGVVVDLNYRFVQTFGYTQEDVPTLEAWWQKAYPDPEYRQWVIDSWTSGVQRAIEQNTDIEADEYRVTCKDGTVRTIIISGAVLGDDFLAVFFDITERKQAEERLAQTARQWQTTFDSANDAIWILDKDQRVLRTNKTAEKIFRLSHDQMVGRHCWEIVHGTTEPIPGCPLKRAELSLHRETMELPIGDSWFAVVVDPILDENGQYSGAVHIVSDITERRRLEAQLHQAQKMEAVGTLAGGIAHDFNNILAAIMGYTEIGLAEAEEGKSNRNELLGVLQAAIRAKDLIQQILTFSRRAEHSLKPIDINEAVVLAGNLLKQALPKMIYIHMDLSVDLAPAMGNSYQIEQILMNLGTNARDAMPDGGTLTIATKQRRVAGVDCLACAQRVDGDYVIITVSDTGVGMTEEELSRVFEPFYTTKDVGKGTGLGLSTIFGIVGSHNGHIACSSAPGKGTTFSIYLPPVTQAVERPQKPSAAPARGGNETILVVDDEQSILDIAARHLSNYGYKALTAISGEKALEVYKDRADEIALVILDLSMPGMGGHKCLRELRSLAPELKVIVATGYSRDGDLNKSTSSMATALLPKPFGKNELLKTVRKVLDA